MRRNAQGCNCFAPALNCQHIGAARGGCAVIKNAMARRQTMTMATSPEKSPSPEPMTGGCQCGAVRYQLKGVLLETYICHCRECQKQSASAFGISVLVHGADIIITQGQVKTWQRPTDSGRVLDCHFCPECGSRLFHGDLAGPELVSIKGGSLDVMPDLSGLDHIWVARKAPGIAIPAGVRTHFGEPDEG
ncbi:aldehyde-activating protein [Thalassospira marina]|uniref:Aldehyde-activating protein n=2 Tax=Thalassospira marina TaxID=2048283 RepID=A0A2N3KZ72_9PROT|nr:aldehyde-activating protein [Thalassospira marina]